MWLPPTAPLQEYLGQTLINWPVVYVDRWSGLHFLSGTILGFLVARFYPHQYAWIGVLALLVYYEMFELAVEWIVFVPETRVDQAWDLALGLAGFFLVRTQYKIKK